MRSLRSSGRAVAALAALVAGLGTAPDRAGADVVVLAPVKDNTIYESTGAQLSNGAGIHLFTGLTGNGDIRRTLLEFDIAGNIPAGSAINIVTLQLQMSRTVSPASAVGLYRVTRDWGEAGSDAPANEGGGAAAQIGDASWLFAIFNTVSWTAPGGDFVAGASAGTIVGGVGSYLWGSTPQLQADVQGWLDTPATNFGWIMRGAEVSGPTAKRFDSRTHPTAANRPRLTVDYTPPMVPTIRTTWGSIKAMYR